MTFFMNTCAGDPLKRKGKGGLFVIYLMCNSGIALSIEFGSAANWAD